MKSKMVKKTKQKKILIFFAPLLSLKKVRKLQEKRKRKISVSLTISPLINFETSSQVL